MSSDNSNNRFANFATLLSVVTFLLYGAAVSSPNWIEQNFIAPPQAIATSMNIPQVKVDSNIGLLWACTDRTVILPGAPQLSEKCESLADINTELVEDWQWIAAGLGVGALVFSFVCVIMSCCFACRSQRDVCLRTIVAILYLLTCGLIVASLVLFTKNKEIGTGVPNLKIDYDYDWGFYIAAVSAVLFFLLATINACVPLCSASRNNEVV